MKKPRTGSARPGIAFERAVAALQARIDPAATVTHNELLRDRLGQDRQFDVVVRGAFAGQQMLGVIECKDLKRQVGTPEVDAFVTKAQDINANFKVLISRRGFTKPALSKCAHYGIQALSLVQDDPVNKQFFIGTRWEADITRWGPLAVSLHFSRETQAPVHFRVDELRINGKRILDWITNYLLDQEAQANDLGSVVQASVEFNDPQMVEFGDGSKHLCRAMSFQAERVCDKYQRLVGINGTGFYNWNSMQATFPAGASIQSDAVPMDFSQWQPRGEAPQESNSGFLFVRLYMRAIQFERIADAIALDKL
jgi:hypothetical protein